MISPPKPLPKNLAHALRVLSRHPRERREMLAVNGNTKRALLTRDLITTDLHLTDKGYAELARLG